jgi:hypothetical protein
LRERVGSLVGEVADLASSAWKRRARKAAYVAIEVDDLGCKMGATRATKNPRAL